MLLEPPKDDIPAVCSEVPDGGLSLLDFARQEVTEWCPVHRRPWRAVFHVETLI
jgi:hypothetical protein